MHNDLPAVRWHAGQAARITSPAALVQRAAHPPTNSAALQLQWQPNSLYVCALRVHHYAARRQACLLFAPTLFRPQVRWVGGVEIELLALATGARIVPRFQVSHVSF